MEKMSLKQFKELVPEESYIFVENFIKIMASNNYFVVNEHIYDSSYSMYFLCAIKSYHLMNSINKATIERHSKRNLIPTVGFYNVSDDYRYFSKYYDFFCVYGEEFEKYITLTADDMLLNILKTLLDKKYTKNDRAYEFIKNSFDYEELFEDINETNKKKKQELEATIDQNNFKNKDVDDINYFQMAGKIFIHLRKSKNRIKEIDPIDINLEAISLLVSYYLSDKVNKDSKYDKIKNSLIEHGITLEKIANMLDVTFNKTNINKYDSTLVLEHYFSYEVQKENHTFNSFINTEEYDLVLKQICSVLGMPIDILKFIDLNISVDEEHDNILNYASTINESIKDYKDSKIISLLIAILSTENSYKEFLIHNNLTLDLFKDIIIDNNMLINNDYISNYRDYIKLIYDEEKNADVLQLDINKILESNYVTLLCDKNNINYDYLKEELTNKKYRELTIEEQFDNFVKLDVPKINTSSLSDIAVYGNDLSTYSNYINSNVIEAVNVNKEEISLSNINELLSNIYIEENTTFLSKIFKPKDSYSRKVNNEVVESINNSINDNIHTLYDELKGYDLIRKCIEIYIYKLDEYIKNINDLDKRLDDKLLSINNDDIKDYTKNLEYKSLSQIVKNKKSTFETSMVLMKQELTKIHQMIVSHYITINALGTAKNDILPLIVSETTINIGKNSENKALELSNNLVSLFQNVLNRNIEASYENLEYLRNTSIPESVYNKMSSDIKLYLEDLKKEEDTNIKELKKD